MGVLLDFEKPFRERMVGKLAAQLGTMYQQAGKIAAEYQQLMLEQPEEAITKLPQFIDRARCINNNKSYEAYTGGPNHDWTGLMLDVLGTVYPELERRAREKGLKQCLKFLDELSYL